MHAELCVHGFDPRNLSQEHSNTENKARLQNNNSNNLTYFKTYKLLKPKVHNHIKTSKETNTNKIKLKKKKDKT